MKDGRLKPAAAADDVGSVEAALADSPAVPRRPARKRSILAALAVACALAAFAALSALGGGSSTGARHDATAAAIPAAQAVPPAQASPSPAAGQTAPLHSHPKVVLAVPPGQAPPAADGGSSASTSAAQPPSDAQVRSELALFRKHLQAFSAARGPVPVVQPDGRAVAPLDAPGVVATVIAAGNEIATTPYKWGGGHGAWADTGYDCSGSLSFALAGAGLLQSPLVAAQFMQWGALGPGRWITIYASPTHTFMVVAGLRFDTSGANGGTRWQAAAGRSYAGFTQRHPPGL